MSKTIWIRNQMCGLKILYVLILLIISLFSLRAIKVWRRGSGESASQGVRGRVVLCLCARDEEGEVLVAGGSFFFPILL